MKLKIYTDGACSGNPGKGGWAAIILDDSNQSSISGSESNTTNNRMELTAVIESLKYIDPKYTVNLYTDSKYVSNGITIWINNWIKNGWRTSNKKDVKNKDLWLELTDLIKNKKINWFWVKGHSTSEGNNIADTLANEGINKIMHN